MTPPPREHARPSRPTPTDEWSPDDDLDARFAAGGEGVLREAYDRYGTLVFTFCRRALPPEPAAEAAQDTFVTAWRSADRFDPSRGSLGGWLMGIARFKVREAMRRHGRVPEPLDPGTGAFDRPGGTGAAPFGAAPALPGAGSVDAVADRMLLTDALDRLPPRMRAVVEMAYYEDLTHDQIAERSGIPLGTVKSDLRRGTTRLRHHLASVGIEVAGSPGTGLTEGRYEHG